MPGVAPLRRLRWQAVFHKLMLVRLICRLKEARAYGYNHYKSDLRAWSIDLLTMEAGNIAGELLKRELYCRSSSLRRDKKALAIWQRIESHGGGFLATTNAGTRRIAFS